MILVSPCDKVGTYCKAIALDYSMRCNLRRNVIEAAFGMMYE